jgi:hypothetical protein
MSEGEPTKTSESSSLDFKKIFPQPGNCKDKYELENPRLLIAERNI